MLRKEYCRETRNLHKKLHTTPFPSEEYSATIDALDKLKDDYVIQKFMWKPERGTLIFSKGNEKVELALNIKNVGAVLCFHAVPKFLIAISAAGRLNVCSLIFMTDARPVLCCSIKYLWDRELNEVPEIKSIMRNVAETIALITKLGLLDCSRVITGFFLESTFQQLMEFDKNI